MRKLFKDKKQSPIAILCSWIESWLTSYQRSQFPHNINNLAPGEYSIEILTSNLNVLKKMPLDSTFMITNYGERKRVDLIYDENRGIVMK